MTQIWYQICLSDLQTHHAHDDETVYVKQVCDLNSALRSTDKYLDSFVEHNSYQILTQDKLATEVCCALSTWILKSLLLQKILWQISACQQCSYPFYSDYPDGQLKFVR